MKIVIVGEAWGEQEEAQRSPFVGPSGWELNKMLQEAGIHRADCYLTNVFNLRPRPTNDITNLCVDKSTGLIGLGPLAAAKYLAPQYAPELERLQGEITQLSPNIIIALGNTAAWAILGTTGIAKIRGTVTLGGRQPYKACKVLPTYHPSAVLRDWSLRTVTVLDLAKAKREAEFPEIRRPECVVYIEPTLAEMEWYYDNYLKNAASISFDIETARDQITCIGFSPDTRSALVIPFNDPRAPGGNYWAERSDELQAWRFVRRVLDSPQPKFGQNGLYDINFLWAKYGIPVRNYEDDTMLLHHALQPESPKGLGFLGSVYTDHSSWKMMRSHAKTIKRDN